MKITDKLARMATTTGALSQLVPSMAKAGLLSSEGNTAAFLKGIPVIMRYRFTTAREIEQAANVVPERIALIDDEGELTFEELRNHAQAVAKWLISLELDEIHLGIMARNGRGIITPLAAKGFAGAHSYLLNIGSSPEQLRGIIKRDGINVLVIDEEFVERLPSKEELGDMPVIVAYREETPSPRAEGLKDLTEIVAEFGPGTDKANEIKLPTFPKHGNVVLMSSGTTGTPKGVVRSEPTVPTVVASMLKHVPWHSGMRIYMTASIFHTWGWGCLNIAYAARCTVITRRVFDAQQQLEDIEKYKAEGLITSPIFLKEKVTLPGDTSSLRFIFSSGHALSPWLVKETHKRFGKILCNMYGSTEISGVAVASMEDIAKNPTIAGNVLSGTDVVVVNDDDEEAKPYEAGRIFCSNSTTLEGYTDPDIPVKTFKHMVQIGDRGYFDDQGKLYVLGRADDMIIVGGENVYPRSVEDVLEPMPGIADLYAGGVDDDDTFARIAVWIVREDSEEGRALTKEAIQEWVLVKLAQHSVPRDVHFVDELPRNATGKVVRRLLDGN